MRLLGKTNMKVNRVGFGGIPIQRITQEDTNNVINELVDNNINFIDTARAYTISEEYIGNAIDGKREKFFIATKSMSRDYESMKRDIEISLKNLKTDYIDLYQIHNLKPEEYKTIFDENKAYKALLEAREEGKIKYIGITSHSLETIEQSIEDEKFSTIQFPYNIIEDQADEVFKKANKKGIGIIVMKPLAGGAIDDAKLAIKYILSKDYIDVVIPGMENIEQVRENVSVLRDTNITEDDESKIQEIRTIMGKRFCRRCEYCLPCPLKINIPQNFLLEGYYTRYNLKDWAKERYKLLEVKASACVECGLCETKCPYELPIREMLKEVSSKLD
ncbi:MULTISPECIES: aldo/keto reductase [Romboutsia]|jgi:predicted aldo/keto reductase-like oxidoreductase|uniref:aldo/keto reductase n=1 Tax=Romboutsia TaxID=1501226 RepID=UPI002173ADF3|nr:MULTISPECIES: aldo/keto reductase [Romboutsia]MCI9060884.1 aldo/keto reductase [Romboutsia sp.]MCI9258619.1 aldo/keto reductase [Romboutsia sp.]